jgi:hypothetical protein
MWLPSDNNKVLVGERMNLDVFAGALGALLIIQLAVYLINYRGKENGRFVPAAAWLRAGILFCGFYLLSYFTGTMEKILAAPIFTTDQLANSSWQMWFAGMVVFILLAYWGIWSRFTIRFDRKLDLFPQITYGLLWGTAFAQLFLSLWSIAEMIGPAWPTWQIYLLTYVIITFWQWFMMDMYWDIYISPEHDTAFSIALKVPTTHIPNVTLGLIFFALYQNYAIFIALQCLALVGCSIAMRMPAPWSKEETPPARQGTSIFFGLPRCVGYLSPDSKNDPYLKQAHLPR